ncbi:MAG: TonB-dependent receptor [Bacteroidota bacterium]|nr:TonB-dependent receptor [Bacteroidota bacterium]
MQMYSCKKTISINRLIRRVMSVVTAFTLIFCINVQLFANYDNPAKKAVKPPEHNKVLALQPNGPLKGTVKDDDQPIPGVSVMIKGTTKGTVTDINGQFTINVTKGDVLVFSFVGYEQKEIAVNNVNSLTVSLNSKQNALNEVVVNGYSSQKRSQVTAAISTVTGKTLLASPVTNVTNALAGNIPGLVVQQKQGRPGFNSSDLYIRGRVSSDATALVIVDGVERTSFGDIDPNEIESINVLKDAASTALYGLKGANGVFVVTTKKGKEGAAKVTFSNNVGIVSATSRPGILNAYESALILSEAQDNVGEARTFSDADVQIFKDKTGNPLLYPDVSWYDALIRKSWTQNQQNLTISGGTQRIKYFTSFGHQFEDGNFKEFDTPLGYSTTPSYTRYNFRARVSMDITKSTNFEVNLAGRNEHRYCPAGMSEYNDPAGVVSNGIEGLVGRTLLVPSFGLPYFPQYTNSSDPQIMALDATYNHIVNYDVLGTNSVNPYAFLTYGGYAFTDNNIAETVFTLSQKLDFVTKGLAFKAQFGYDATLKSGKLQRGSVGYYNLNRTTLALIPYSTTYNDFLGAPAYTRSGYDKTNLQLFLTYNRSFGKHNVTATVVGQRELKGSEAAAAPYANQGIVTEVTYNYDNRYFLTGSGTYNGSENYASGYRYGFFPSMSVGYNLANEKFMKDVTWISMLKFRASIGKVGIPSPGTGRFYYQDKFAAGTAISFGSPSSIFSAPVYYQSQYGNPYVTFEKSLKRNAGFDASLLHDKLNFTFDIFDDRRTGILTTMSSTTFATYGASVPSTNYGENYNHGYEISATYRDRVKDFTYSATANVSYAKNIRKIRDEAPGMLPNLRTSGTPIGTYFGYHVLGFYADQNDINNSPVNKLTSVNSIPGDLKYQDVNNDGMITSLDQMPIGHPDIPEYNASLNLQVGYKGFQLSALFNAVANVSSNIVFQGRQYYEPMMDRWTPTHTNASWPAVRPGLDPNPNSSQNDFTLQDASYIKLRNVQLSYTFPRNITSWLHLSNLTLYVNGQNLKTWTKFYGVDPENNIVGGTYNYATTVIPTTKVINFGLQLSF